ncbi:hypothetical protein OIV83_005157 [Microbotryomycetes sp. JL201]|nr:hypothetical protein OIV83_005157 [Microbotryomycetes sp. JL201]
MAPRLASPDDVSAEDIPPLAYDNEQELLDVLARLRQELEDRVDKQCSAPTSSKAKGKQKARDTDKARVKDIVLNQFFDHVQLAVLSNCSIAGMPYEQYKREHPSAGAYPSERVKTQPKNRQYADDSETQPFSEELHKRVLINQNQLFDDREVNIRKRREEPAMAAQAVGEIIDTDTQRLAAMQRASLHFIEPKPSTKTRKSVGAPKVLPADNWSAARYSTNASFVFSQAYTKAVVDLLAPQSEDYICDLGCGSGELTRDLLQLVPHGLIVGVDSSADLLAKAKELLSGDGNVELVLRDGHDLGTLPDSDAKFDAVFSNAALHWMSRDPQAVADGAHKVLKHGGRFVAEMGGFMNVAGVRAALYDAVAKRGQDPASLDPFYWPTPAAHTRVLEKAGFRVESCELVPRYTPLPTGLSGWLETFAFAFLKPFSADEGKRIIREVCDKLEVDMKSEEGWAVMYTRLRFKAWKD